MKKIILAGFILVSSLSLSACGFDQACCPTNSCNSCSTSYSYSGSCGYDMCSRTWY